LIFGQQNWIRLPPAQDDRGAIDWDRITVLGLKEVAGSNR
jgi:hypothetical protein